MFSDDNLSHAIAASFPSPGYAVSLLHMTMTPVLRSKLSQLADPSQQGQSLTKEERKKKRKRFIYQCTVALGPAATRTRVSTCVDLMSLHSDLITLL